MNQDALTRRLGWLVITVVIVALYWSVQDAPFVYDDKIEVIGNTTIRFLDEWRAILLYNVSRALLLLSYAVNYHYSGSDPTGYHLTNIAIHALTVGAGVLMAESVGRLADRPRPLIAALVAGGLWAIHPMGTEAVTYITGRSESLCALWCFAALLCQANALLARRDDTGTERFWRLGVLVAFGAAAICKEVGAVTPAAVLAMEWLLGGRRDDGKRRIDWAWMVPFVLLVGIAVVARFKFTGQLLPQEVDRALPVQLTTQAWVWLRYLALWLAPVGQTLYHHVPDLSPTSSQGLTGWLGIGGLVGGGLWWGRKNPAAGFALLAGALYLLPSSSVVPLKESMAEHRAYQTGLWLLLAITWSIPERFQKSAGLLAALAVLPLLFATQARNAVWSSEVALWEEAVGHHPDVAEAWYGLGDAHRFSQGYDRAEEAFEQAVALDPNYLDAWNNLGIVRAEQGQPTAEDAWRAALRVSPSYCKAHNNLGSLAYRQKRWDLAISEFRSTLAHCPDDVVAHYSLGNLYGGPRLNRERAIVHYEAVLNLAPTFRFAAQARQKLNELTW
ncbi:MAG: tetratricopeptide (TPR) repeat protein [Myxococcota bacterium]|jgi:tetratricopeptide (TPR) repeat protein